MRKIEVAILEHNMDGMPIFLAKMTQRGHLINSMQDLLNLFNGEVDRKPSKALLTLPHTTIQRMNYLTVAITGLSTKCVSQIRTHAKRLTFLSTSTQYSSFEGRDDNYVIPFGLSPEAEQKVRDAYATIHDTYSALIKEGYDKDKVGYLLPQGLRKAVVISGSLDAWRYVISLRLCHRNTEETQYVMKLIYDAIEKTCGPEFVVGMKPPCADGGKCLEGKFSCGRPYVD